MEDTGNKISIDRTKRIRKPNANSLYGTNLHVITKQTIKTAPVKLQTNEPNQSF